MLSPLQHLVLIAEHGTFTEAARKAHLSQPALSASIRRLEEQLGARLLERGRQGARLTAAGEAFMPRARDALAALHDGQRAVAAIAGLETGEVRIGAGATVSSYLLPPILSRYRKRHPAIVIQLREMGAAAARERVRDGRLDLAIVDVSKPDDHGLEAEPWREDRFVLIGSPKPEADRAGMITVKQGATTRAMVDRHFSDLPIVMELTSISAVMSHVREGIGVALVPEVAARAEMGRRRLCLLRHEKTPIRRPLVVVHRGRDRLSPAAAALRELLL
ncbi:MAG: LysR family transcriptional regulator [Polyangiaceae bacterium]